jgi:predicted acetyltransferase
MAEVEVMVAEPHERGTLANLMQLYVHDFSEHWAGQGDGGLADNAAFAELGDDGRFSDYPLEPYWLDEGHVPLLLRVGGRLAGFALLDRRSHGVGEVDRNVAEFFVARFHRRGGVGTAAARAIFSRYPGRWEAAIARRNVGALAFWRRAVSGHPQVRGLEEVDVSGAAWNGPVLCFRIGEGG